MTALTTSTKVKNYLGISGSTYDTLLTDLINSISSQVETFCGRQFTRGTYTEYFDTCYGDKKIFLANYPVISLTSFKYQTGTWANIVYQDYNANDFLLNGDMGKITMAGTLPEAEKYLQAVYVGGYLIDFANETDILKHTLPADLALTVTELVAQAFTQRQAQGVNSMSTEGQSISYKTVDTERDFTTKLARYINY